MIERERKRALDEEFQRALSGDVDDFPWGLTPDRVAELRPTQDDIELWLVTVHYPDVTRASQLTRGRKGYFTRRHRRVWRACATSYDALDRDGRPGYYEVWTTGKFSWDDHSGLGTVWGRSTVHARQVAQLLFDHVAGPDRYYGDSGRGEVRVRFLGGSLGEGEESARIRQSEDISSIEKLLGSARKAAARETDRIELLQARLDAIAAVELTPCA